MSAGVYSITNMIDGKIYVGSSARFGRRKIDHFSKLRAGRHRNRYLQRAYNKYGEAAFRFTVLEIVEQPTAASLVECEQKWIDRLRRSNNCYNLRKHAQSNLGIKLGPEFGAKISAAKTGVRRPPLSEEWRKNIGSSAKRALSDPSVRQRMSAAHAGKPRKPEHVAAMHAANRGRLKTPEARANMAEAAKRRCGSPEGRQVMLERARRAGAGRSRDASGRYLPKMVSDGASSSTDSSI